VFKISSSGAFTTLYVFTGGNDGANPAAGLVQGSDGYFYGTTSNGGAYDWVTEVGYISNGWGTVFKISSSGALTSLYSFTGGNDGRLPSGLVQGSDGYFYGTTSAGGANGAGTVFKISSSGAFTSLYSFTGTNDGGNPEAALVQGSDGYFYGTTGGGGIGGNGTVFRLAIRPTPPAFLPVTVTNGTLNLTWTSEPGGSYQVQYSTDLTSGPWINLGEPLNATGPMLSAADSITNATARFYRLVRLR
jgi:uncharacterized repeat protein (TIGR03803 family)